MSFPRHPVHPMRVLVALILAVALPVLGLAHAAPFGTSVLTSAAMPANLSGQSSPTELPGIVAGPRLLASPAEGDRSKAPEGARQHTSALLPHFTSRLDLAADREDDQALPPRPRVDRANGSLPARASPHLG